MGDWIAESAWPPLEQRGLHPDLDVDDLSMMLMRLRSGAFASHQQCHDTPDYWRNDTVIGERGRLENVGDGDGGVVRVGNTRGDHRPEGDAPYPIVGDGDGHDDADAATVAEFVALVRDGAPTVASPVGAWEAVATGVAATESLRDGATPRIVPELPGDLRDHVACRTASGPGH